MNGNIEYFHSFCNMYTLPLIFFVACFSCFTLRHSLCLKNFASLCLKNFADCARVHCWSWSGWSARGDGFWEWMWNVFGTVNQAKLCGGPLTSEDENDLGGGHWVSNIASFCQPHGYRGETWATFINKYNFSGSSSSANDEASVVPLPWGSLGTFLLAGFIYVSLCHKLLAGKWSPWDWTLEVEEMKVCMSILGTSTCTM